MAKVIRGIENIAGFYGWNKRKLFTKQANGKSRYQEMLEAGAIYMDINPTSRRYTCCAFPENLRAWQVLKTSMNRGKI